ncbi:MAG TPA: saccharopine dehydrogenase NADP-binding domain-containing protein [Nocardioidaceae bacterium]|nr:saccharopine dehydrogenase NADP-binding domain-containing protein [Nocardioidaceae bacterium]
MTTHNRRYDIVLLGATGFTGGLTAEYLAHHAPAELRWAIAGRDVARLERLASQLALVAPDSPRPGIVQADISDPLTLGALAGSTRLVASTVGPFMEYGEPVVAACVDAGTDYIDITGEPEFVDRIWLNHHELARQSGVRLVHCCGFDSIPADLGVWYTLRHLPPGTPLTIRGYVRINATPSAGTYHSAVRAFGRVRQSSAIARRRKSLEASPAPGRRVGGAGMQIHRVPGGRRWGVPLPIIDPLVVLRSARALEEYGPAFRYGQYAVVGSLPKVVGLVGGAGGLLLAAQIPPARDALLRRMSSGEGPPAQRRSSSWFRLRFVATVGGEAKEPVVTEVSGGDPGYDETAKMLGESALCMVSDDLPEVAGQVTTTQAMGDALVARLQTAGIDFRVVDD